MLNNDDVHEKNKINPNSPSLFPTFSLFTMKNVNRKK
jgi:hypothetical protein